MTTLDPSLCKRLAADLVQPGLLVIDGRALAEQLTAAVELHAAVTDAPAYARRQELLRMLDEARDERDAARAEVERLRALIDTPRTDEFFEAVRFESAHQVKRWGKDHDARKLTEDWIALFVYLLGKAATAHWAGDRQKLEHRVITCAAVALNWWRRLRGVP